MLPDGLVCRVSSLAFSVVLLALSLGGLRALAPPQPPASVPVVDTDGKCANCILSQWRGSPQGSPHTAVPEVCPFLLRQCSA